MTLNILPVAFAKLCQLLTCAQERRLSTNSSGWELGYKGTQGVSLLIPGTVQLRDDLWLSDPAPLPGEGNRMSYMFALTDDWIEAMGWGSLHFPNLKVALG